jgi:hypothetical protein
MHFLEYPTAFSLLWDAFFTGILANPKHLVDSSGV